MIRTHQIDPSLPIPISYLYYKYSPCCVIDLEIKHKLDSDEIEELYNRAKNSKYGPEIFFCEISTLKTTPTAILQDLFDTFKNDVAIGTLNYEVFLGLTHNKNITIEMINFILHSSFRDLFEAELAENISCPIDIRRELYFSLGWKWDEAVQQELHAMDQD
ncbi:hypothetical protein [Oceanidesulfovibrio marinus]|nr:hypothetical protein [Oceanidesulfovibrio marinus]